MPSKTTISTTKPKEDCKEQFREIMEMARDYSCCVNLYDELANDFSLDEIVKILRAAKDAGLF